VTRPHRAQRIVLVDVRIPNTAIAASPMNFSTVPPWRSRIVRSSAWYLRINSRRSSGSVRSPSEVEPRRSQNRNRDGLADAGRSLGGERRAAEAA